MGNDMVAYFNDSSELFITRDLQIGDHYTVFTPIIEGGQTGLEALVDASPTDDADYQTIYNTYTQLPTHMEQKVYNDVADIVKGATTPYGKAMAIMRHLQKYYRYTLTPDTPPANQDFVTYFLYVGKEGYCTYYASAMTVMCRMAGLPSRYVEGFLAEPSADGLAYVTGKDAHAWTEVYFEGFGWIPFDPTPLQQTNSDTPPKDNQEPEPSPSPSPDDQPTPTPDPNQPQDEPSPDPLPSDQPDDQPDDPSPDAPPESDQTNFPWIVLLGVAALAGLIARIALRMPERVAKRMHTEKEKIFVYGSAVQRLLLYAKRTPKNGETPLVFAKRVDSVRVFPAPILPLWRILALSNYSRMEPAAEQTQRAHDTFQLVYRGSHPLRKLRFLLSAAFDPRFYRALDTPAPHDKPPRATTLKLPKPSGKAPSTGKGSPYARNGKGVTPLGKAESNPRTMRGKKTNDKSGSQPSSRQTPVQPDTRDAADQATSTPTRRTSSDHLERDNHNAEGQHTTQDQPKPNHKPTADDKSLAITEPVATDKPLTVDRSTMNAKPSTTTKPSPTVPPLPNERHSANKTPLDTARPIARQTTTTSSRGEAHTPHPAPTQDMRSHANAPTQPRNANGKPPASNRATTQPTPRTRDDTRRPTNDPKRSGKRR